ncbi:kinase-like domain-containing protein [Mariannaea sp. PMI_226]|nr:kinase-like domain-containing protein [Mariannaea sp. PMI_226]
MADTLENEIQDKVKRVLRDTPYASESLRKLTGGTANFIYHAVPQTPLPEQPDGVVVKQGEGYVASIPSFAIPTSRCDIEQQCLAHLTKLPPAVTPSSSISTPDVYFFNQETNTQVQEYLPNAVSLKDYALKHYASPTSPSLKRECEQLGHGIGAWLRSFHDWSNQPEQEADLRKIVAGNKAMQLLKLAINYQALPKMADTYSTILGDAKAELQAISEMAVAELKDESTLQVIHGDFWTGNILLPNEPIKEGHQTPVRVVDWEMCQLAIRPLDLGQAIAELWQLKLYKDIDAGEWLITSFADGYGTLSAEDAFRAIIHVGVHLICFGSRTPGWGTPEQNLQLVETGKEVLLKAWAKDREWFKGHVLGSLFGTEN